MTTTLSAREERVWRNMRLEVTQEDEAYDQVVFVFGSNLSGAHGAGAAKDAQKYWGARHGVGVGNIGQSYAIPTKDHNIKTLPLYVIRFFVQQFIQFAKWNPDFEFQVTAIGCGLAGYKAEQIAPMFWSSPPNVHLPLGWRDIIQRDRGELTRMKKKFS